MSARYAGSAGLPAEVLDQLAALAEANFERQGIRSRIDRAGDTSSESGDLIRHAAKLYSARQDYRQELLTSAARLLEVHWPTVLGKFGASKKGAGGFYWRFSLPGVLSVHEKDTGRCVVRSKPGAPTVMDHFSPDEGIGRWMDTHGASWAATLTVHGSAPAAD
ncbi:MAG: hypothetical protein L6Q75_20295 [Burkholderiaceae bacterium]|nr:hypothetical protein [Burkholderiaceae bacterium]